MGDDLLSEILFPTGVYAQVLDELREAILREEARQWREWFPTAPVGMFDPFDPGPAPS